MCDISILQLCASARTNGIQFIMLHMLLLLYFFFLILRRNCTILLPFLLYKDSWVTRNYKHCLKIRNGIHQMSKHSTIIW
jgi:hypothetical protein